MLIMTTDGKKSSGDVDDIKGTRTENSVRSSTRKNLGKCFPVFVMKAATLNDACLVIQMFKRAKSQG